MVSPLLPRAITKQDSGLTQNDVFVAEVKYALVIGKCNYGKLRDFMKELEREKDPSADVSKVGEAWIDLPEVKEGVVSAACYLTHLGLSENQIDFLMEPDEDMIREAFNKLKKVVSVGFKEKKKVLAYVYYGGHGVIDGGNI